MKFTLYVSILFETAAPSFPPPPTYEEAFGGAQEIPSASGHDYTFGKLTYAPKYSYFNLPPTTGDMAYPPATGQSYPAGVQPAYPPVASDQAYPPVAQPAYPPAANQAHLPEASK